MNDNEEALQPDRFYHVYNRANGKETLFANRDNYRYFLIKYRHYILPVAKTYAFCLMPNHFHFLIGIKTEPEILSLKAHQNKPEKTLEGFQTLRGLPQSEKSQIVRQFLSQQFSHLQNGYTQAFNKQQNRRGSLFMHPFKRKAIEDKKYLIRLICYMHYNPVEAGLCEQLEDWKFSSYPALLSKKRSALERETVMEWFGGNENFVFIHKYPPDWDSGEFL